MPDVLIQQMIPFFKSYGIKKAALFGSCARGQNTANSDIDLVVYGCPDLIDLEDKIEDQILTVREINLFDYDTIKNKELLEDIKDYAIQIY